MIRAGFLLLSLLTAGAPAGAEPPRMHSYKTIRIQNAKSKIDISYPRFNASDPAFKAINSDIAHVQERSCDTEGSVRITVKVVAADPKKIVIEESYDGFCKGDAHPSTGMKQRVYSTWSGKRVDLWALLPEESRVKLKKRYIEKARNEDTENIPLDEGGCGTANDDPHVRPTIGWTNKGWIMTGIADANSRSACETDLPLSSAELKELFPENSPAREILD